MHELSVAQHLVELVSEALGGDAPARVLSVRLRLGPLAGVEAQALQFAYPSAAEGTPLEGSRLFVEHVTPVVYCRSCRTERELEGIQRLRCPACGTHTPDVVRGRELEVVSVEVADDPAAAGAAPTAAAPTAAAGSPPP